MGILTKIDNGLAGFRAGFAAKGALTPNYARPVDGTHTYNLETTRFGMSGLVNLMGLGGQSYYTAKENLKMYYRDVFFLQDCINLYADIASQVKIVEVDKNGKQIDASPFLDLLKEPNAFQNQTEFIKELIVNALTTGGVFQYGNFFKNGNLRISPALYNLDFNSLNFPKIKDRYKLSNKDIQQLLVIEKLEHGNTRRLEMFEIAYFYDQMPTYGWGNNGYNADKFLMPVSRIFAILSSLHTLINGQNTMCYLSGPAVNKVLSRKTADGVYAPLPSEEKADIETKLNGKRNYGTGKAGDIVVSDQELQALDLTRDNRKMQVIEMQENAKENVRNCFLIPKDFFGDSTYENKQFSEARFTLNQVKSITDNWLNELTAKGAKYFEERGTVLMGSYDHMPSIIETKTTLKNKGFKDKASAMIDVMAAYNAFKLIEPNAVWDEFLQTHNFNDFLKAQ